MIETVGIDGKGVIFDAAKRELCAARDGESAVVDIGERGRGKGRSGRVQRDADVLERFERGGAEFGAGVDSQRTAVPRRERGKRDRLTLRNVEARICSGDESGERSRRLVGRENESRAVRFDRLERVEIDRSSRRFGYIESSVI